MSEHEPSQDRHESTGSSRPERIQQKESKRGFRNRKIAKPAAIVALVGVGAAVVGIGVNRSIAGRLDDLRQAETAAMAEDMQRDDLQTRAGIEIYMPGTVERDTPAMKNGGLKGIIPDNISNTLGSDEALIVYRPRKVELQTGQHGSIDWSQYQRDYNPQDGVEVSAQEVAKHTYYVNRGAAKEDGRVVVCEVDSDAVAAYLPNGTMLAENRRVAWGKVDNLANMNDYLALLDAKCDTPLPLQAE